uniref:Uncharacterized protein n=1 Tax=Strigamia maritima TaxID=126957 RepID=T1JPE0_STRMM
MVGPKQIRTLTRANLQCIALAGKVAHSLLNERNLAARTHISSASSHTEQCKPTDKFFPGSTAFGPLQ